jgi:hypothetical protein
MRGIAAADRKFSSYATKPVTGARPRRSTRFDPGNHSEGHRLLLLFFPDVSGERRFKMRYFVAWLLGVPLSVLVIVWLIWG